MIKVYTSTVIDAPADAVWAQVRDFNGLPRWTPFVAESRIEEGQPADRVGCVRNFRLRDGGVIRERLLTLSDYDYQCTYAILESPMGVDNYVATLKLTPVTDGGRTFAEWWAEFDVPPEQVVRKGRLQLTFNPDGTLSGMLGGYRPVFELIQSPAIGGIGSAIDAGIDCAAQLKNLKRHADGIRVFDVTMYMAGPWASMLLGSLGAGFALDLADRLADRLAEPLGVLQQRAARPEPLLLVALDDRRRWYRYHHLFGDVQNAKTLVELDAIEKTNRVGGANRV